VASRHPDRRHQPRKLRRAFCKRRSGTSNPAGSRTLTVLLEALQRDHRLSTSTTAADGLVRFKTTGELVSILGLSLGRLIRRRGLLRYIAALRRQLEHDFQQDALIIQRNRWLGWRAVPRALATRQVATTTRLSRGR
jgi:hypothetical protein